MKKINKAGIKECCEISGDTGTIIKKEMQWQLSSQFLGKGNQTSQVQTINITFLQSLQVSFKQPGRERPQQLDSDMVWLN